MFTALCVATRIVANPVSNLFQKRLADAGAHPLFVIAATHGLLSLIAIPLLLRAWSSSSLSSALTAAFWLNITVSALLAVVGNALLVYALKFGDLSVLGSINAYKAVLSLVLGIFLIGEVPNAAGLAGVVLILFGSDFVVERKDGEPRRAALSQFIRERGVQYRFAALICSATEAVFLKRAVLQASPLLTFCLWCALGLLIAGVVAPITLGVRIRAEVGRLGHYWTGYVWLGLTTGLMQLATLLTFDAMQVGYSLALFQLSTLISVFLGYRYFQEQNIARRLFGSVVMIAGAVLIALFGANGPASSPGPALPASQNGHLARTTQSAGGTLDIVDNYASRR